MVSPMSTDCPSPSSSPTTPPSPLPISIGPGHHSYLFSPSPSPSPPFSPSSPRSSPETVPLLRQTSPAEPEPPAEPSAIFSLDKLPEGPPSPRRRSFKHRLGRVLVACCCFCSPSTLQADEEEKLGGSSAVELNSRAVHSHVPSA